MSQTNGVNGTNGAQTHDSGADVTTDYLIVGTGPAGSSLACFLTQYGERSVDSTKHRRPDFDISRTKGLDRKP